MQQVEVPPRAGSGAQAGRPPARGAVSARRQPVPSLVDLLFVLWVVAVPTIFAQRLLNTDGDLGRHIRVGEEILRHGLFYTDRLPYTRAGRPFIPYEWLSEVLFALAHRAAGIAGVAVFSGVVIGLTYALVVAFLERRGVDPLLAYLVSMAAAVVGSLHWLARPHLFTLLGTVALVWILESERRRAVWWLAPLFALWANLHGGFLYGLVLIALYLAGDAVELLLAPGRARNAARVRRNALGLGLALLGTLATPAGFGLLGHVTGYLGETYLVNVTAEYQSPDFHEAAGRIFLVALLLVVGALATARRRLPMRHLLVVLANIAFALHSMRNIPLFALTVLPLVALDLDPVWRQLGGGRVRGLRERFAAVEAQASRWFWSVGAAFAMALLAGNQGRLAGTQWIPAEFDSEVFPVQAVARAREAGLGGRLFNWFPWGGYVLYAWPEQKVFIDGQTDFYGEALTREYGRVHDLEPGWRQVLDRWGVGLVLVPTDARVAGALSGDGGWRTWYRDRTAVLLVRAGASPAPSERR